MNPPEQRGIIALFGEQSPVFGNNIGRHLRIRAVTLLMKDAVIDGIAEKSLDFYKDG